MHTQGCSCGRLEHFELWQALHAHQRVTALKYRGGNRKKRLPDVALNFLSGSLLPVWPWQSTGASWMRAPVLLLDPSRDRELAAGQRGEAKLQLFPPSTPNPWAVLQYLY